jgi:hypothetical protein
MSPDFFYRMYSRFSQRNSGIRYKITPLGVIVISVSVITGIAGLNIFQSGLYRISIFCTILVITAFFSRDKKIPNLKAGVFFDRQYSAGERAKYTVRLYNGGSSILRDLELIPIVSGNIPSREEFMGIKEPGEEKRNFWDRNIYYFRWMWHILRLHKVEFPSIKIGTIDAEKQLIISSDLFPIKRGRVGFEGFVLLKKDFTGIFTTSFFLPAADELIILPARTEISKSLEKHIRISSELRGRPLLSSLLKHKAGDFSGLREYAPGDPVKNIHWKTWAKTGEPAVIERSIEKIMEYTVVLLSPYDKTGNKDLSLKFEDCLSYMTSTFYRLEEDGFEITFIYFNDNNEMMQIHADKDAGNYALLYNAVSEIQFSTSRSDPESETAKLKPVLEPGCNLIVFSTGCLNCFESLSKVFNALIVTTEVIDDLSSNKITIPRINKLNETVNLP